MENEFYEPRIIDFDLSLRPKMNSNTDPRRSPSWLLYTEEFRPQEIFNAGKDDYNKFNQEIYLQNYSLDPFFREDSYAIAKTLFEIYDNNKTLLNTSDPIIKFIADKMIRWLGRQDIAIRWSTAEALTALKEVMRLNKFKIRPNPNPKKPVIPFEAKGFEKFEHFEVDPDDSNQNTIEQSQLNPTLDSGVFGSDVNQLVEKKDFGVQTNTARDFSNHMLMQNPTQQTRFDKYVRLPSTLDLKTSIKPENKVPKFITNSSIQSLDQHKQRI